MHIRKDPDPVRATKTRAAGDQEGARASQPAPIQPGPWVVIAVRAVRGELPRARGVTLGVRAHPASADHAGSSASEAHSGNGVIRVRSDPTRVRAEECGRSRASTYTKISSEPRAMRRNHEPDSGREAPRNQSDTQQAIGPQEGRLGLDRDLLLPADRGRPRPRDRRRDRNRQGSGDDALSPASTVTTRRRSSSGSAGTWNRELVPSTRRGSPGSAVAIMQACGWTRTSGRSMPGSRGSGPPPQKRSREGP